MSTEQQTPIDLNELFARCRNCLVFLGVDRETEDHTELNNFLKYREAPGMLDGYDDYLAEVANRCDKIERWKFKRDLEIVQCAYYGVVGERYEFPEMTITFQRVEITEEGRKAMTTMTDKDGNHFVYWNSVNVGKLEDGTPVVAEKGQKVAFRAGVREHKLFREVKQTVLERVLKAKLLEHGLY